MNTHFCFRKTDSGFANTGPPTVTPALGPKKAKETCWLVRPALIAMAAPSLARAAVLRPGGGASLHRGIPDSGASRGSLAGGCSLALAAFRAPQPRLTAWAPSCPAAAAGEGPATLPTGTTWGPDCEGARIMS